MPPLISRVPHRGILPTAPPLEGGQVPVLFLHGILGSPGNFERPAQALVKAKRPFVAPAYGEHGTASLQTSLQELLTVVDNITAPQIDIVGHSAGGLLGLRIAQLRPKKVRALIGLGAAFHGVPRHIPFRIFAHVLTGKALTQITRHLPATAPKGVRIISVISDADFIVPARSSELGELVHIHGVRHEFLPWQSEVILQQLQRVDSGETPSGK